MRLSVSAHDEIGLRRGYYAEAIRKPHRAVACVCGWYAIGTKSIQPHVYFWQSCILHLASMGVAYWCLSSLAPAACWWGRPREVHTTVF
jgi:hypothetical protein